MREYSMLRVARVSGTRSPYDLTAVAPGQLVTGETELTLERAYLTDAEVVDVASDPGIAALTPTMPTRLITPRDITPATVGRAAWGINTVKADTSPFDGRDVMVAVLDTGIDRDHPAFAGVSVIEKDFTATGNGDGHGHGTHSAGTVFGRDVGGTRIGVARGIERALIGKVVTATGNGRSDWMQDAVLWAAREGARVISMSLGLDFAGAVAEHVTEGLSVEAATLLALQQYQANVRAFEVLVAWMRDRTRAAPGVVVVTASGDDSRWDATANEIAYRVAATPLAASSGSIAVGAVLQTAAGLSIAAFSNSYPQICAPGVAVLSARPGGDLCEMSGTSTAAPHVAGIAALWWQRLGSTAREPEVTASLLASCRSGVFATLPDSADMGAGVVTAPQ